MRFLVLGAALLVAGCSDRIAAPVVPEALSVGSPEPVFVATNRTQLPDGSFGVGRQPEVTFLQAQVSIPPGRTVGSIADGQDKPKPDKHFVLADLTTYDAPAGYRDGLGRALAQARTPDARDVLIYVHGFNNSFTDAAFRGAQLARDFKVPGPVVSYAWPSRGNPLGYQYDWDSALYSRDGLADLMRETIAGGARKINLVAHSMGGALTMEVLRQLEIDTPGWAARHLGGVILISPDLNVDVFRAQVASFGSWPQPFVIVASEKDRLLLLSALIRGERTRLGSLSEVTEISDLPVTVVDVSAFDDADSNNHFIGISSESFIQLVLNRQAMDESFLRGETGASLAVLGRGRVIGRARIARLDPTER